MFFLKIKQITEDFLFADEIRGSIVIFGKAFNSVYIKLLGFQRKSAKLHVIDHLLS